MIVHTDNKVQKVFMHYWLDIPKCEALKEFNSLIGYYCSTKNILGARISALNDIRKQSLETVNDLYEAFSFLLP